MDAYVSMKQRKSMQDGGAVIFNIQKQFLSPDHVVRQAIGVERKLQSSCNDDEKISWDWNKYVALCKEQHKIIESLLDHGYSGMDEGTEDHHFLQGIKSTELEAVVYVVQAQPEKYGKYFDITVSYLGHLVMKKGLYFLDWMSASKA